MNKHISSPRKREIEQLVAARRIGNEALGIIHTTYGSGYPGWTPGTCSLPYHNGHHGQAVGSAAAKVCAFLGLSKIAQAMAKVAGNAHDLVQLKGRGTDERESAEWLDEQLAQTNLFPKHLRHAGVLSIIGTQPVFNKSGQLIGQRASELEYPTKTTEYIAKSVACGDFGELYTPTGPYVGHQLLRELQGVPGNEIPPKVLIAFERNQLELLERYRYPLKEAEIVLATHRSLIIQYGYQNLRDLESGVLNSWTELLRRDKEFIAKCGVKPKIRIECRGLPRLMTTDPECDLTKSI